MKIHRLYTKFPTETVNRILAQDVDVDLEFPGFVDVYNSLSRIIPKHFIVIDFGCALAPQCWYFRKHKKYIGIDWWAMHSSNAEERFSVSNTEHFIADGREWIKQDEIYKCKSNVFAICSYVGSHLSDLVQKNYRNCFCYYPTNEGDTRRENRYKELTKNIKTALNRITQ